MFEEYFEGEQDYLQVENLQLKTKMLFKDTEPKKR